MARCGCLGTVWGINGGASVGGPPIDRYGTPEQKESYLAPLLRGQQRHCLCVTEPASMLHICHLAACTLTITASRVRCSGSHDHRDQVRRWKILCDQRREEMGYPRPVGRRWADRSSNGPADCKGDLSFHCASHDEGDFEA